MTLPSYVGRYEVRDEIGRGGFGVVVQAWDEELDSVVALKMLHAGLARDEEVRVRFLEEARLLRRIRSPHVITVHDVGRLNDGRPYFVMDFADRGTLDPRLQGISSSAGPDAQSVSALVEAVADGLSALHEAGVVHRDIKPANILFQAARRRRSEKAASRREQGHRVLVEPDERILLGDLGIAKDLLKHGSLTTAIGGTPLYQAPEQGDFDAEITPAADVYAATALLWHVLTGQRPPRPKTVEDRLGALPAVWREFIARGMALEPTARFEDMESWRSAAHDCLAEIAADARSEPDTETVALAGPCPYKGLAAYQPEDAGFFYGREALIDELVRRMQLDRVLVVAGPSGSGKSSLVRAGLIPALNAGALPSSDAWRVVLFTPGRDPLAELYLQLGGAPASNRPAVTLEDLIAHPTLARHLGRVNRSEQPLVLCIDQFEELFTLAPAAQRSQFVAALSAMADPADSQVRIVLVVRADFYASCAQIPWLAERITANQVLVGPMTASELRRAISEPAERAGLYLERGLIDAIIDEAGSEAGSLPLVAHALVETWRRRRGNAMTLEGFRAAGGVAGAISQSADATYEHRFDHTEREATKRLFLRLVTPGEGTPDTRRALPRSRIEHDANAQVMRRVVECLTEVRLLTVDDVNVQIAHEALLRTWPRLRGWIEEFRDDLRTRQRISRAAAEWDAQGRDSDLLYRGTPLLSALEWAAKNPEQLGDLERAFLEASDEARAKAEAVAAEKARRARRVRRAAVAALSFLALGATLASAIAFLALREARYNEQLAEMATAKAHERFAAALGSAAYGLVDKDPLLALVLGAEAVARAESEPPGYDARATMVAARRALTEPGPFLMGSPIPAGDAIAIALRPDGSVLAVAHRDGSIALVDTATRAPVGPGLRGHEGGVRNLDFAPDGRHLASVGADGTVRVWTIDGALGGEARTLGKIDDEISGVGFSPLGALVASAGGDGAVRLWNAMQGPPAGRPLIDRTLGFQSVEFTPDGRGLVAGSKDGTIYGWTLPSGEPLFAPVTGVHSSKVLQLVFSPGGTRFATASNDGTSMVLEYPSGRIVSRAFEGSGVINAVVFGPHGRVLIGGDAEGAVKLWDVERQELVASTPRGHSQGVADAELSADGKLLATLGEDQLIRLWRWGTEHPLAVAHRVAGRAAKGVALSADGRHLAAGDDSGVVQVWELGVQKEPMVLSGHAHQVWAVAFSPNAALLASGDRGGQVRIWTPSDGALRRTIAAHEGAVWSLGFTPDGKRLMTASDMQVRLWDVDTGNLLTTWMQESGRVTRAALSPDGASIAAVSTDGKVRLRSLDSGRVMKEIAADDNVVWSAAFSPDGQDLATASSDEVVALWDAATGTQRAAFTGHTGGATDVGYLNAVTLVAVDRRGQLHLWDTRSGRRLTEPWQAHSSASWRIAVHPDEERFVTTGDDGWVRIWDEFSIDRACEIGAPSFDAVRRKQYLGEGERSVACDGGP